MADLQQQHQSRRSRCATPSARRAGPLRQRAFRSARRRKSGCRVGALERQVGGVARRRLRRIGIVAEAFSANRSESKRASENSSRSRSSTLASATGPRFLNRWASIGSASRSWNAAGAVEGKELEWPVSSLGAAVVTGGGAGAGGPTAIELDVEVDVSVEDPARPVSAEGGRRAGPFGRRVAAEVEQALERVEDRVAAAAAHPAFGDLELILHDAEDGSARRCSASPGSWRNHATRSGAARCRSSGSSRRPRPPTSSASQGA